jgi:YkoY family integral membrane protein
LFAELIENPWYALAVIGNLILIESLLSIDNAAVLATMVMDLPKEQRGRALKYGIFGAYFFRGLCLIFASWLITIWWLKPLGGLYLVYLCVSYFYKHSTPKKEDDFLEKPHNRLYVKFSRYMSPFWSTVVLVELMDLAFSLDNVFAAVALTDNLILICTGVFIGILSMRFVAQRFVKLIEKFPYLQTSAFLVVGVLGLKLTLSLWEHLNPDHPLTAQLKSESTDLFVSAVTLLIFFLPIILSPILKKYGKKG